MVLRNRLIGKLNRRDRLAFAVLITIFMLVELVALLHALGIIGLRKAIIGVPGMAVAGIGIEMILQRITNPPKEDEETNASPYLGLAYIIPPLAASGGDENKWLIAVSLAAFVLLMSRIVWVLMQSASGEVGSQE